MSKLMVKIDGHEYQVELDGFSSNGDGFTAVIDGKPVTVKIPNSSLPATRMDWIIVDERPYELSFDTEMNWMKAFSGIHELEVLDMEAVVPRPRSGDGRIKAPIPGLITRLLVSIGDEVEIGQPVMVLEAMKMENEIRAPCTGTVKSIHVQLGQGVIRGEVLAEIKDCQ
ncbi:MAG: acetyl-CoA carboxylase biotin carboxyl carrier protein subunit [Chloroflexi bacterium]|nr:MAG: acetyl-CoA carboxylase biotin carboxyl carrier protein subunit [Chloroflexota bacterium]